MPASYPYTGPEELRAPIETALQRVVDPEVAMTIVDVGLVYGVTVADQKVHVLITMTSAACPVTELIIEDVENSLDAVMPEDLRIEVQLTWEPPWSAKRMSERAKLFMGW